MNGGSWFDHAICCKLNLDNRITHCLTDVNAQYLIKGAQYTLIIHEVSFPAKEESLRLAS